jgi:hypothetical protein
MGNGGLGGDTGGFWAEIIMVAGYEFPGTRNANKGEMRNLFDERF